MPPAAEPTPAVEIADAPPAPLRPRIRFGRVAALVTVIAAMVLGVHASPVLKIAPGPAPELTRQLAGSAANPVLATGGRLHFTTVEATRLRWAGVLWCKVTGCATVIGSTGGTSDAAEQSAAEQQMAQAQTAAAAAARAFTGPRAAHPGATLHVDAGRIGGPSAGLMLTLADVDALADGDLTGGRTVAGTGTITAAGTVGPISGIPDKVVGAHRVGASVFFAPAGQAPAARAAAPAGMTVVPVGTLADAVRWLCGHGATSTVCR